MEPLIENCVDGIAETMERKREKEGSGFQDDKIEVSLIYRWVSFNCVLLTLLPSVGILC
jgi:hypothetical protein